MIRLPSPPNNAATAAEWKAYVDSVRPIAPALQYDATSRSRAQGNVSANQLFDLFVELLACEMENLGQIKVRPLINPTTHEVETENGEVVYQTVGPTQFTYAYPDELLEVMITSPTVGIATPIVGNYITFKLESPSALQGMTGPVTEGNREQRPRFREVVDGSNGEKYTIQGQLEYYTLTLEVFSRSNAIADVLLEWVNDTVAWYAGWLISKGVKQLTKVTPRMVPSLEALLKQRPRIVTRGVSYLVELERLYVVSQTTINQISIRHQ